MLSRQTISFLREWGLVHPDCRATAFQPYFAELLNYMFPDPDRNINNMHPKTSREWMFANVERRKEHPAYINYFVKPSSLRGCDGVMVVHFKAGDKPHLLDHTQHYVERTEFMRLLTEQLTDGGMILLMNILDQPWVKPGALVRLPLCFWKVVFNETEICKVRRFPGLFKVTHPAIGEEKLYAGMNANGLQFPLSSAWFSDNRQDRAHQERLDKQACNGNNPWSKVDPGKFLGLSAISSEDSAPSEPIFVLNRRVHYRQFEGERFCYLNSFCSALTELGLRSEARNIHAKGFRMPPSEQTNDFVHRVVEMEFRGTYQFRRLRKKNNKRFDPLRSRCNYPTVVKLKQKGPSSYPHCVTIYKNMIFDSTFANPLQKNRNNFDYICGGKHQYLGVHWAKQLQPVTVDVATTS